MSLWDDPKFKQPSNAVGDWKVIRSVRFQHPGDPLTVKFMIEQMTVQLLQRDTMPASGEQAELSYSGTSTAGGHPSTVRLALLAVLDKAPTSAKIYELTSERTAPKRWEDESKFTAECERRFAYWCSKLDVVSDRFDLSAASPELLQELIERTVAQEDEAASFVEDPAPIAALQKEVLDGLRAGMLFFTAGKEGGTHLTFNGKEFQRSDYGDEPNVFELYPTEAGMSNCLRAFYDWDANRAAYPHKVSELEVWRYIRGQLRNRHG